MSETDPNTGTYASPTTGWIVGTGALNYAAMSAQVERVASVFGATVLPNGTADNSLGDCLRSENTYNGSFASGNWTLSLAVQAQTGGGAQDGNIRFRVFRGTDATGSGWTELTASTISGAYTNLTTTTTQRPGGTFNPGAVTVTGEYLFIQIACQRTGAGAAANNDVNIVIGSSEEALVTPDFTAAVTGIRKTFNPVPFVQSVNHRSPI